MGVDQLTGTVYVDSNIIIYIVEQEPRYHSVLLSLLAHAASGQIQLITSALSVLECCITPLRSADSNLLNDYRLILFHSDITLVPIGLDILWEAANLRAQYPALRTPDAIHWATARAEQANYLLTNDHNLLRFVGAMGISPDQFTTQPSS